MGGKYQLYIIEHLCYVQTVPAEAGPDQAGGGKEALLPAELLATVETLKNTIKEEKSLSSEVGQVLGNISDRRANVELRLLDILQS